MPYEEQLDDLRHRLDAIAEDLADLGRDRLTVALHDELPEAAAQERKLAAARRAVLRALAALS